MGLPPYGPEPYASANSATPAQIDARKQSAAHDNPLIVVGQGRKEKKAARMVRAALKRLCTVLA